MPRFINLFKGRKSVAAFLVNGQGLVAGMLIESEDGTLLLRDSSGDMCLPDELLDGLKGSAPAWLAFEVAADHSLRLIFQQAIACDTQLSENLARHTLLRRRLQIKQAMRTFFLDRHFLEVDSPLAVLNPGSEPFLDSYPVGKLWLRSSPELAMKRLLAQGFDRIFQFGPCFRKGDVGAWHREEFCMLEWYRSWADLNHIIDDLGQLLAHLAPLSKNPDYFVAPLQIVSVVELFAAHLSIDLIDGEDLEPLRLALADRGIAPNSEDDWDTLYFLLFLNFIEPLLGMERPTIVTDYPASQSALAKLAPKRVGHLATCFRLELYVHGVELANAFYELTDPQEQRARFHADRAKRLSLGKSGYDLDESFLAALDSGLPPSAGIALGTDRLTACLLGSTGLAGILPFE